MKRRNGKAALTRLGKVITVQISGNRSTEEVKKSLNLYELAYADLVSKHEDLTILIEEDELFETEERWLEDCQETFLRLKIDTEDYLKQYIISKENQDAIDSATKPTEDLELSQTNNTAKTGNAVLPVYKEIRHRRKQGQKKTSRAPKHLVTTRSQQLET